MMNYKKYSPLKVFEKLLSKIREGDILVVDSLDRLGRTAKELIRLLNEFKEKGIQFKSLKEGKAKVDV